MAHKRTAIAGVTLGFSLLGENLLAVATGAGLAGKVEMRTQPPPGKKQALFRWGHTMALIEQNGCGRRGARARQAS